MKSGRADSPTERQEYPGEANTVQDVTGAEKQLQGGGGGHGDIVERIAAEDVEIQIENLDVPEAHVLENLFEGVLRECILVVEILRQRLSAGNWVGAIQGETDQPCPGFQLPVAQLQEFQNLVLGEVVQLLLGEDQVE
jgi:hypothetical protein